MNDSSTKRLPAKSHHRAAPLAPAHHRARPADTGHHTGHHRAAPLAPAHHRAALLAPAHHRAVPAHHRACPGGGGVPTPWILAAALFLIPLLAAPTPALAAELDIAYIDMNSVFNNYHRTLQMQAELRDREILYRQRLEDLEKNLDMLGRERDQMRETAINLALNAEIRADSRREAERLDAVYAEKEQQIRQFRTHEKNKLVDDYLSMRGQLVDDLRRFLAEFAELNGYDLVLDTSGLTRNFIPVVLYHPPENDITAQVLEKLNQGHEDVAPPPDDARPMDVEEWIR